MTAESVSLGPLVGRVRNTRLWEEKWKLASCGQGQVVLVSGEAGIGKSRLVEELSQNIADASSIPKFAINVPHTTMPARFIQQSVSLRLQPIFARTIQTMQSWKKYPRS